MRLSRTLAAAAGAAALLLTAVPAQAAHEGNNKALLASDDGAVTGTAVVNYVKGRGEEQPWTGNATVSGLAPGEYRFTVTSPNGMTTTEVCSFTADGRGTDGCSNNAFDVGGFATAEIRDEAGAVVADGIFARRGNCREADQAGSRCEAPGRVG